eukprot:gene9468-1710_t
MRCVLLRRLNIYAAVPHYLCRHWCVRTLTDYAASTGSYPSISIVDCLPNKDIKTSTLTEEERTLARRILTNTRLGQKPTEVQRKHPLLGEVQCASRDLDTCAGVVLQQKAATLAQQGVLMPDSFFHSLVYIFANTNQIMKAFRTYELSTHLGHYPQENVLSILASACAQNHDLELAQEVLLTMDQFGVTPHLRTYWKIIEAIACYDVRAATNVLQRVVERFSMPFPEHSAYENMNQLVGKLVEYSASLPLDQHKIVMDDLFRLFEETSQLQRILAPIPAWDIAPTTIDSTSGLCAACGDILRPIALTQEDQELLNCAISKYLNTQSMTIKDAEDLQSKIRSIGDIEIFVDGLNVGHYGTPTFQAHLILTAATHLEAPSIVVSVHLRVGRLLLLANDTEDDIRFIYAAIQLRPHSYILTNDLFRDHLFQVSKFPGGNLFDRWRRGHCIQYEIVPTQKNSTRSYMQMTWPPKHDNVAQQTETGWHLPGADNTWLCCASSDEITG